MKKLIVFWILFLSLVPLLKADTDIYGGDVSGSWMLRGSPYIIHDNITVENGDSLYIDQGVEVEFMGNYYLHIKGAVFADGTSSNPILFTVNDTTGFYSQDNLDGSWGGIYIESPSSSFRFNYTEFEYTKDLASGIRFSNNAGKGGAICIENGTGNFNYCTFHDNYSIEGGGAAAVINSYNGVEFLGCSFYNNISEPFGGAILADNSYILIKISVFHNNEAETGNGGAIYNNQSTLYTSSNLFYSNSAEQGGAIYINNSNEIDLYNNTISDNTADTGGGIYFENTDYFSAYNNIVYFNNNDQIYFAITPASEFEYSDIQDGSAGVSNTCITDDPQFMNRPYSYQLNLSSPCVDSGAPDTLGLDIYPFDCARSSRVRNGVIDMGAYEYDSGGNIATFYTYFHADIREGYKPLIVQFYDDSSDATSWSWDFGDGTTSNEKNPLHTYQEAGVYTVSLTASGPAGSDTHTETDFITVKNATYITDPTVSGEWTLQNSPYIIDTDITLNSGETLTIEPGVSVLFNDSYTFEVYGSLTAVGTEQDSIYFSVIDTTGYSGGTLTGWQGIKFQYVSDQSQLSHCVIEYVKKQGIGGGLYFNYTGDYVTVTDSKITKCSAENGGGAVVYYYSNPIFTKVKFISNTAENRGGAIYILESSNPEFLKCEISGNNAENGAAIACVNGSSPTLHNLLITNNQVTSGGILYFSQISNPDIRNLTISDNSKSQVGYALFLQDSDLIMKNTILWNTSLDNEAFVSSTDLTLNYTDIRGGWDSGDFVYNIEPNFKDTQTYKLDILNADQNAKNPLIDAGDPNDDFSNEPMPNGGRINLGAYGGTSQAEYSCSIIDNTIEDNAQWDDTELHIMTQDVVISPSATLTIQPGTVIQAMGDYKLQIFGTIIGNATRGDTIIFTNNYNGSGEETPWDGILFQSETQQNCLLSNFVVENALNGVEISNKNIQLSNAKIRYNLSQNPTVGLSVDGSSDFRLSNSEISGYITGVSFSNNRRDEATPTLTNTRIRNSSSSSRDDDVGISISGNVSATIDSCIVEGYTTGISQSGEESQTASPTITNTRVRNSASSSKTLQTGILLQDISSPQLQNIIVEDYQTAVKIITTRRDQSTPTLTNTRLRNNPSSSKDNATCGILLSGNVVADMDNNIIEDFDTGIRYIGTGQAFRDTPTLTNTRIRNSSSSSRDTLLTTGLDLQDIVNITVDGDTITNYQVGVDILNNSTRTTATPTLTNSRIRNSSSPSRDETYGIKMRGNIAGSFSDLQIFNYDYGVYYIGSGTALRDTPTLTNTRIRNSASSSRTTGTTGIYFEDVINSTIDSCIVTEFPIAIKMVNNTRTTATPTLTNSRLRSSPSSSRYISKGVVLEGDFNGFIKWTQIVNQDSAIVLRGSGANPNIKQNLIYFDVMEEDDQGAVAIYARNSNNLYIRNNTIYDYDYAFISDGATATLENIISYKENPIYEPVPYLDGVIIKYSDFARPNGAVYSGVGNINQNPMFYKAKKGNFRLLTGSPCIDSGDPEIIDWDTSRSDMGRYFVPRLYDFDSQSMFGVAPNHNVQFTEISTGFNEENSTWAWDMNNDGTYDAEGRNPTYNFIEPGIYTVKLKVTKYTVTDSIVKERFIVVQNEQLPAPQNLTLSINGDDIQLTWDDITWPSSTQEKHYIIYKSYRPDGDFEYLGYTNNTTSYTHSGGALLHKAFYKVIAFDGDMRSLMLFIQRQKSLKKLKTGNRR